MPTVLRADGFQFRVLLPPREHGPPHVRVQRAGAVVIVNLSVGDQPVNVRKVLGMRRADVVAAVRLVEANVELLEEQWRKYHG